MMKSGSITRKASRVLGILWTGLVLAAPAFSETRSAFSTVSVRIERHAGVVIPASKAAETVDGFQSNAATIAASGNAPARMIITSERFGESLASRGTGGAGRTAVTVFEP
jgi:hypothetical protein